MSSEIDHGIYEGAGFLLTHQKQFIFSARIKKAKDAETDPIKEVEHLGGKPEPEDNNDPYQTAYAELIEEAGGPVLDSDWKDRVKILYTFQPFSKMWIWCFLLELNTTEFDRLMALDAVHDEWKVGTERSFEKETGRVGLARKAIEGIAVAKAEDVIKYIQDFKDFKLPDCNNRMKEAKVYGKDESLLFECPRLSNPSEIYRRRLRGFNLVMFEDHLTTIQSFLNN